MRRLALLALIACCAHPAISTRTAPPPTPPSPASAQGDPISTVTAPPVASTGEVAESVTASTTLAPLVGEPFVSLPIAPEKTVLVSVPRGATGPRPLIIATHGAGGRAESQCEMWRRLFAGAVWVACPRGVTTTNLPEAERHYFYRDHHALGAEVDLVLRALRERFAAYLDERAPIYAGYSQGAGMGAMILPDHGGRFTRAVLIEGGFGEYHEWDIPTAQRFAAHGGERVLFVCGRLKCAELARDAVTYLQRGGLQAKLVYVEGAGHDVHALEGATAALLGWVTEGDGRWPSTAPR